MNLFIYTSPILSLIIKMNAINLQLHVTIVVLCSPRLSRPEIYWFHVSGAAIVRSSNRKGIRSAISTGVAYDDFLSEIAAGPSAQGGTAVAERTNQTLATIVRCLKLAGNFPDRAVSEFYDTALQIMEQSITILLCLKIYNTVFTVLTRIVADKSTFSGTRRMLLGTNFSRLVKFVPRSILRVPEKVLVSAAILVKTVNTVY